MEENSKEMMIKDLDAHFQNGFYLNPGVEKSHKSLLDFFYFQKEIASRSWPRWIDDVQPRKISDSSWKTGADSITATMINHATVLLEFEACNVLTDPVFSERVSPVSFSGPRRRRACGMRLEDLPPIDAILLSHNHYDHMDISSLKWIHSYNPACLFLVPLGNAKTLIRHGMRNNVELDWHDSYALTDRYRVHSLPAQHWSGRGLFDHRKSLWCSFLIESKSRQVFFCGDSGYGSHFKDISQRFSRIDLSLLPICAYEPRWFLKTHHMNPHDSVLAHLDLKSKRSLAIHFGTFQLSSEGPGDPVRDLATASQDAGLAPGVFTVKNNGESLVVE